MNQGHADLCSSPDWAGFIADDVLPVALAECEPGADVLEVGPGYGAATARLARRQGLGERLTVVEIDSALAARLREKFPDVRVVDGRGEALPFADSSFSAVLCFTMLHHVWSADAQDELFGEAHRVLRPGGVFAGSDSIASPGMLAFHEGDTFTPVDPHTLAARLAARGFSDIVVRLAPGHTWFAFSARRP